MLSDSVDSDSQEVLQTLFALNEAWVHGRPDELKEFFHPRMVAITPDHRERVEGGAACMAEWKAFADAAKIHHFHHINPQVEIFRDTAVVTYYFDLSCEMGGQTVKSTGRDMFVFVKENGRWQAVADQFSAYPEQP